MNTSTFTNIKELKASFTIFKEISENIYAPILRRKFKMIRKSFTDEK